MIIYSDWLKAYCSEHSNVFVRDSESMVADCLKLDAEIPSEYRWKFSDVKSLEKQLEVVSTKQEFNSIFWTDQVRNVEAYAVMTWWRGIELVRSCINGMNERDVIVPAISARSLLELTTVFLLNANTLEKSFEKIVFPANTIVTSTEIESIVVKMIWGTRYQPTEEALKQTNIMTSLTKLSKSPGTQDLMPNYEYLCDIAHPSFIGNTSYWSHIENINADDSETRILSRLSNRNFNHEITEKTLWSLAWSAYCLQSSFITMRNANAKLLSKLQDKIK
ncbi:hypothetical protein [Klebsiella michiganensis]|uniref:hypothetical protein n=1 Tax=Klebsiella michiganensis TaxID=1134687 RepID=UPI0025A2FEFA|nr:hypothetical protein [Klebsiella michiganensis]MDM6772273.1 hypothetical protein [Klebsiella michiganensis]HDT0414633.1 hypothetical protein [Klebsiella michiganensis]